MITKESKRGFIQFETNRGEMTLKQIAERSGCSITTVMKWKKRTNPFSLKRKRSSKLTLSMKRMIFRLACNKFTGNEEASSRKITSKLLRRFPDVRVSHTTVNRHLRKVLSKPRRSKVTFKLTDLNKGARRVFADYVINDLNIKGENVFWTDEKRFLLDVPLNPQSNQIRLNKKALNDQRAGKEEMVEKLHKPLPKFSTGFMVSGGLSYHGVGKLIFYMGTMDSECYRKTLDLYKEDIIRLNPNLYLMQDNAAPHCSKANKEYISQKFSNFLHLWPANSPDLNPIEGLWAILQERLHQRTYNSVEEMKKQLIYLWNRIPKQLCERLVNSFNYKIRQIRQSGSRFNRLERRYVNKVIGINYKAKWKRRWNSDGDIFARIVYNKSAVAEAKKKTINNIKKLIAKEKKHFKTKIQPLYTRRYINSLQLGISRGREYEAKGRLLKEKYEETLSEYQAQIARLQQLTSDEFYDRLTNEQKVKLINEKTIGLNCIDNSTMEDENESDSVTNDDGGNEESVNNIE
jgi:transposase